MSFHRIARAVLTLAVTPGLTFGQATCVWAEPPALASPGPPASFASLVERVKAAVVSIRLPSRLAFSAPAESFGEEQLEEGLDDAPVDDLLAPLLAAHAGAMIGAGVIVDASGATLTNGRVALANADLEVVMLDGSAVKAEIVGIDERTDLALLRLDPARRPFPHVRLGDSDRVIVGEWVIAIGAPYGLEATVTAGIISATARQPGFGPETEFLQSDAAINAGNAGGPLVSTKGEVIGIVAALGRGDGVGFAVPSNTASKVAASLSEWGRVRRAWLGVTVQAVTAELARGFRRADTRGALVADVEPGGPAAAAGLRPGDIVLDFDARPLGDRRDFERALAGAAPAQTVRLGFWRSGRITTVSVVLVEEPGPPRRTPGLGLAVRPLGPGLGVIVIDVDPRSPAATTGVHRGDVIREIDQQPVRSVEDYERLTRARRKERPLVLRLQRGATALYVALTPSR
ncbi:MAG TPA: PDZ domain-containing protein [Methylomirabilota bacterium]|nr:PDZ domain-containing protein [Methylomirabilota bacterium]